jgi:hypothetical protein
MEGGTDMKTMPCGHKQDLDYLGEPDCTFRCAWRIRDRYVRAIRNADKQHYASLYWSWLASGRVGPEPNRGPLSFIAAQAVRSRFAEFTKGQVHA